MPSGTAAARLRAPTLDHRLARGDDPATEPLLALRAAQLTSDRARADLATALERRAAPPSPSIARVAAHRPARAANAAGLAAAAARLRAPRPAFAAGLAALAQLVRDGTGPLYGFDADALAAALTTAMAALDGHAAPTDPAPAVPAAPRLHRSAWRSATLPATDCDQ